MKTFLSIGSGPGIGAATAERFAKEGYRVVLTSRDRVKLDARVSELNNKGYTAIARYVDAGDLSSVTHLITETIEEFASIDVLHFNSASMQSATIESQKPETFVQDLVINIGAALVAVQSVSKGMLERGDGTILLTGGGFAITPTPEYLSLGIGKAGIRNLTHGLFESFKAQGVHVATVTVCALVGADSDESREIAEAFWKLHAQPVEEWTAEVQFPS